MPALRTVYAWELRKLLAQKRTYLGLGMAVAIPLIFTIALLVQSGQPNDVAFGRYVRQSGLAVPPVLLIFGSIWLFPLIAALVAGDIVAAEDNNGTLKTILTRSTDRSRIFAAKALAAATYAFVALIAMGTVALVAGIAVSGLHPLVTLSGTTVSAGKGIELIAASLLVYMLPLLGIVAIALLLSVVTHNSAAAVVGALMISLILQLVTILPGLGALHPYLLTTQFNAWQGFLRTPVDYAPVVRAVWVCSAYAIPAVAVAFASFMRRDVTGG